MNKTGQATNIRFGTQVNIVTEPWRQRQNSSWAMVLNIPIPTTIRFSRSVVFRFVDVRATSSLRG